MGQNGARIHDILAPLARTADFALEGAPDLADAIGKARAALAGEGVVLLSRGAPSFGPYRDYTERGRHFAGLAGFDPQALSGTAGPGNARVRPGGSSCRATSGQARG